MRRIIHTILALCLLAFPAVFLSCGSRFDFKGAGLHAYREQGPASGESFFLSVARDRESVFGSWEVPTLARSGLVEGEAKVDGSIALRLYGASTGTPVASLLGRYVHGEDRIEATLAFGEVASRAVVLEVDRKVTEGLSPLVVEKTTREGLPEKTVGSTRFIFQGFEPSTPASLRAAWRKTFQSGLSLAKVVARERDGFFGDYTSTLPEIKSQLGDSGVKPWYYEARQLPSFRSGGLLVMVMRKGSFSGLGGLSQSLRCFVVDMKAGRLLTADDILAEGWQDTIRPLLAESLREELGLPAAARLTGPGIQDGLPLPSRDWLVYSRGLGFHYPPGSIMPEEDGEAFILLPFSRLGALVKPGVLEGFGLAGGLSEEGGSK